MHMLFHLGQTAAIKGTWPLWTAHIEQKSIETLTMVGWNNNRAVNTASSKSFKPKRFTRRLNKVEGKYIQKQQLNQFHCYNKNMELVDRMDQNVAKCRIDGYPNERIVVVPFCLNGRCCSTEWAGVVLFWQRQRWW